MVDLFKLYEVRRDLEGKIKPLKEKLKGIEAEIARLEARMPKAEVIELLRAEAAAHGWTLGELFGSDNPKKTVNTPIYRHPKKPELSWTGRGRQPRWIKDAQREGLSLLDLHIVEQADRAGRAALRRSDQLAGRS